MGARLRGRAPPAVLARDLVGRHYQKRRRRRDPAILGQHPAHRFQVHGDRRLTDSFRSPELLPLGSRIRVRLNLETVSAEDLANSLRHALEAAGNPELMTPALIDTLTAHAAGNRRLLMNLGAELLAAAVRDKLPRLDEQLFLQICGAPAARTGSKRR